MRILALLLLFTLSAGAEIMETIKSKVELPPGWVVFKRYNRSPTSDLYLRLKNPERKIQLEIAIGPSTNTFEQTAAEWKARTEDPPKTAGYTVSGEQYQVIARGTGRQAVLNFQLERPGTNTFVSSHFWMDQGKAIMATASAASDVSNDPEVVKILNDIAP